MKTVQGKFAVFFLPSFIFEPLNFILFFKVIFKHFDDLGFFLFNNLI